MLPWLWMLQAGAPTVGDTVWIARTVAVPSGGAVRPAPWAPTGDVEALGPPRVTTRGDSVEIAYPAVAWLAGQHAVEIPGPLLLLAGGGVDSLPAQRVTLTIASVLPAGAEPRDLKVQPPTDTVRRNDRTLRPVLLLLLLSTLVLVPLHIWWRRRGKVAPLASPSRAAPLPLARWNDLGESRVVLAAATATLRAALARGAPGSANQPDSASVMTAVERERPDWPAAEIREMLASLDEARFMPAAFPDAGRLADETIALASRLGGTRP
jgi:hypothetical protein